MRPVLWLQETRLMRFEEAYGGWREDRLSQDETALILGVQAKNEANIMDSTRLLELSQKAATLYSEHRLEGGRFTIMSAECPTDKLRSR